MDHFITNGIFSFLKKDITKGCTLIILCLLFSVCVFGQGKVNITGHVKNQLDHPLIGVTIKIKNKTGGTITDVNGKFSLKAEPYDTLVLSYIGYDTRAVPIGGKLDIEVTLQASTGSLNEVVIVGYGKQKKKSLTAAIATVSGKELAKAPVPNVEAALAGRLPGLTVQQHGGEPGLDQVSMFLRGRSTLNDQHPLILIDGVERSLATVNVHNIASISILKDASATAIYGVRGANGVILVTTKRGIPGKTQIKAMMSHSMRKPTFLPDPVSAYEFAFLSNQVAVQQGLKPPYSDYALERYRLGDQPKKYPVRDFMDEYIKDFVPMTQANLSVRGGSEKMRYFTSIGFLRQEGLFVHKKDPVAKFNRYDTKERVKRFNFRSNINIDLTSSLSMFLNLGGAVKTRTDPAITGFDKRPTGTVDYFRIMNALIVTPNLAYNDLVPNGEHKGEVLSNDNYSTGIGSVYGALNRTGYKRRNRNLLISTLGAKEQLDFITKGLSLNANFSYDATFINEPIHFRNFAVYEASASGDSVKYIQIQKNKYVNTPLTDKHLSSFEAKYRVNASINYDRRFQDHHVTAMVLFDNSQRTVNIQLPYNYVGLVGRVTYAYKGRYLAEFDAGYNGSEQFAPGHQFGFFPAISFGWIASDESFFRQSIPGIDFLKFRFSWGKVGNDRLGGSRFLYLDDWGSGAGWPGLPAGNYQKSMPNKQISWEVATKTNIGINTSFLDNMFTLDLDMFYEIRNNILLINNGLIPGHMFGQINLPPVNQGRVNNRGFELNIGFKKDLTRGLRLGANVHTAYNRNDVISVNEVHLPETYAYRLRQTGYLLGQPFGYKTAGFFNSLKDIANWPDQSSLGSLSQLGDIKYLDLNGDGVVNVKDQAPIGYPSVPQWTMGAQFRINYKHFGFSFLLQGVAHVSHFLRGQGIWEFYGNYTKWHLEAWSKERYKEHKKITYPRLSSGRSSNLILNDFWLVNASYFRLKNIHLTYNFPKSIAKSINASNIQVYLGGFNLITLDYFPKKYTDPELSGPLTYPIWKTYRAGIRLSF